MHWRLLVFAVRGRTLSFAWRHHTVLAAGVAVMLVAALINAKAPQLLPWRPVTLIVSVEDSQFVSYVQVRSECCPPLTLPVGPTVGVPKFVLQRGDYIITAGPSPLGQQQHWYYTERTIHVDADRTFVIQGSYG